MPVRPLYIRKFATGAVALVMSVQAINAKASVAHICPELDRSTQMLSVRIGTGCKTGMARFKEHDLQLAVDQNLAQILVSGDISYHPIESRIVTADCAGAQTFTLTAKGIEPRHYTLSHNGQWLGTVDFVDGESSPDCLHTARGKPANSSAWARKQQFREWSVDPEGAWNGWRGSSVLSLLEPILGEYPESMEGRPQVKLRMEKMQWDRRWPNTDTTAHKSFLGVWITRKGLLDDSVSGDRYFVEVRHSSQGWRVANLWSQHMCARGTDAGQWTNVPCP